MHSTGVRFRAGNNPARRGTQTMISATQLYDFVHCPHRVSMDAFGDATERDETSPFVELLWEQGLVAAPSQCVNGLVSGRRSAPDRSVHSRRVLALIVCHPLHGQRSTVERVGQQPLQGFHLAMTAFLCCLDDTLLQSPDLEFTLSPVDLYPLRLRAGGCTHRLLHVHLQFPPAKIL